MGQPETPRSRIEAALFRYLEAREERSSEEVLAELCRSSPDLEHELRALVAELEEGGLADGEVTQERLGDFRVIRRLGAGGMGVVHLAEQVSLGRLVALKVVRPEQVFFESARLRFRREIESSARLSHPGIAAVYSFGEARGLPYFAQEYVPGASLDAVLRALQDRQPARLVGLDLAQALRRALPTEHVDKSDSTVFFAGSWEEVCARIALAAAEALEHAHSRGVLHRDVKPSNLLLVPSGRVVLVDFGLATIADGARLTRTGSVLGSLPYMAPEVLDGGEASVLSDVYSLGVTLYELATLSLPFASNRAEELRRQVLDGRPLRPRQRNTELSRDFETIVACAMERAPNRRYVSAARFADDLRAFLERRPISARPAGPMTKVARLVARKPALVFAVAVSVLLALGGPLVFGVVQARHSERVQRLNEGLGAALAGQAQARQRAETHFELAAGTVEHLLEQFSDRALTRYPVLAPLRLGAIERAVETFEALRAQREEDVQLTARAAHAYRAQGDTLYDLRRMDEALTAHQRQVELCRTLTEAELVNAEAWHQLGIARSRAARTLSQLRRYPEAIETLEAGLRDAREALALAPGQLEFELALSSHLNNLAMNFADVERYDEARATFDECIELADRMVRSLPEEPRAHEVLARALRHRYDPRLEPSDGFLRAETLRRARASYEHALALEPGDRGLREDLVHLDHDLAAALIALGDLGGAHTVLAASRDEALVLAQQFPDLTEYEAAHLEVCGLLAHVTRLQGEWPAARVAMLAAAEAAERLADLHANDVGSAFRALMTWTNFANFLINSPDLGPERHAEAVVALERARARFDLLAVGVQSDLDGRRAALQLSYNRAVAFANLGRCDDAETAARAAQPVDNADPWGARLVADAWCEVRNALDRAMSDTVGADPGPQEALLARRDRAAEEAFRWLTASIERGYADRNELESTPALEPLRADTRFAALLAKLPQVVR